MNKKNISLVLVLISLSIFLPLPANNKSLAQETGDYANIKEIIENPQKFIGQTVSVRGETENVENGSTFILSSEEGLRSIFGEDEILIINVNNRPSVLPKKDTDIQVTGRVTQFILQDIQIQYGLTLDPTVYAEYELKPAILADSIALAPEPGEVTKKPQAFYDQKVAIKGKIKNIVAASIFTLDEDQIIGGSDLVVVNLSGQPLPLPNQKKEIIITGFIRSITQKDLEKYYNLNLSSQIQANIETNRTNIPVLIADTLSDAPE